MTCLFPVLSVGEAAPAPELPSLSEGLRSRGRPARPPSRWGGMRRPCRPRRPPVWPGDAGRLTARVSLSRGVLPTGERRDVNMTVGSTILSPSQIQLLSRADFSFNKGAWLLKMEPFFKNKKIDCGLPGVGAL